MGLADGSGAWWFRYLLMNPARGGCSGNSQTMPVQVWATWFPANAKPETWIQAWSAKDLHLGSKREPFHFRVADNVIDENSCRGALSIDGHDVSWDLQYFSTFGTTLSNKGWIGFSRTRHSDGVFSGRITLDGRSFAGNPLGSGLQGHNCGYRHRSYWLWMHAFLKHPDGQRSTLEALVYDLPLGFVFRKAVLWHKQKRYVFTKLQELRREQRDLQWQCDARSADGTILKVAVDASGPSLHILPYFKTDCSGSFEVFNNSLAHASVRLQHVDGSIEELETRTGAVLEMGGSVPEIIS
jgi:hypothetical protein